MIQQNPYKLPQTPSQQQAFESHIFSPFSNFTMGSPCTSSPPSSTESSSHSPPLHWHSITPNEQSCNSNSSAFQHLEFTFKKPTETSSAYKSNQSSRRRSNHHSIFTPSPPQFAQQNGLAFSSTPIRPVSSNLQSVSPTLYSTPFTPDISHINNFVPSSNQSSIGLSSISSNNSANRLGSALSNKSFNISTPQLFSKENQLRNNSTTADRSPTRKNDHNMNIFMHDSDEECEKPPPSAPKKHKPTKKLGRRGSSSVYKNLFESAFDISQQKETDENLDDSNFSIGSMFLETPSPSTPLSHNQSNCPSTIKSFALPSTIKANFNQITPISSSKSSIINPIIEADNSDDEFMNGLSLMRPPPPRSTKSQIFNDFTLGMYEDSADLFDDNSLQDLNIHSGSSPVKEDEVMNDINFFESPSLESKKRKALRSPSFHRYRSSEDLESDSGVKYDVGNSADSFFFNPKAKLKTK